MLTPQPGPQETPGVLLRLDGGHPQSGPLDDLLRAIGSRSVRVAVVGLGSTGLRLLSAAARAGFPVTGIDRDIARIDSLRWGRSPISGVDPIPLVRTPGVRLGTNTLALEDADVVVISVPTPMRDGLPDLMQVKDACTAVASTLRPGRLVIVESAVYPGVTGDIARPILERIGLRAEQDFGLACAAPGPDRAGHALHQRIVAGMGSGSRETAEAFFTQCGEEVLAVDSLRDAEMARVVADAYRHVTAALVNEMATLAPRLGADIWRALEAAAGLEPRVAGSVPWANDLSGAIDPTYISAEPDEAVGYGLGLVEQANAVNRQMPRYIARRILQALDAPGRAVPGARVAAIGIEGRVGGAEMAGAVLGRLIRSGISCSFHDPDVRTLTTGGRTLTTRPLTAELLAESDCVALLADPPPADVEWLVRSASLVFDAIGATRGMRASNVVLL